MGKLIIKNRYGVVPNDILNNPQLSLKAKGMFAYLQSKPDGWKFSIQRISSQLKEGRDCIRRTLQELEKYGYLTRKLIYDNIQKRIKGYDYILHAKPILLKTNPTENLTTGFPYDSSNKDNSKKDIYKKKKEIYKERKKRYQSLKKKLLSKKEMLSPPSRTKAQEETARQLRKKLTQIMDRIKI